jgi:glycosyltransferase involved in cell wall biosynthesis
MNKLIIKMSKFPFGLVGFTLSFLAVITILFIQIFVSVSALVGKSPVIQNNDISTLLLVFGFILILIDISALSPHRRAKMLAVNSDIQSAKITVVLTAYNDEESIGAAVDDFKNAPNVVRVIVVDNSSSDNTVNNAQLAGAIVVKETRPGYGQCVYRALEEGARFTDTDLVALCEGDSTFRAADLQKFLTYIEHGEVINGTRIVEQLREPLTQLTNFMYFGNFFVAKILELKHLGRGTITDVGTTYKMCKSSFLRNNLKNYNRNINLEFNAHFLDVTLSRGHRIVEIPITFHPRVGTSKGGNSSNSRALMVGIKMILGIYLGWFFIKRSI